MKKLLVTLTVAEGKRLIAKGLLVTDAIQEALKNGYLCVTMGTTSAYLVEEIRGEYDKTRHIAGIVVPKGVSVTKGETRFKDAIFHKGEYMGDKKVVDILPKLGPGDVIVKSVNAIDAAWNPIVLLASPTGGTVGSFLGSAAARNITVVAVGGLEKCIPSLYEDFAGEIGTGDWDYAMGTPVGAIAMPEAVVFTEIDAFEALFDVHAIPITAGGVNGAEGSFTFFLEGEDGDIDSAHDFLQGLKGEPPFPHVEHIKD
ncbi:MAG: hypothetical protein RTU92_13460 [Candidatus Thorarchaeota archaeon]